MGNGVTLYLAKDVGARNPDDVDIMVQNMQTVKLESMSPAFKQAVTDFCHQLVHQVTVHAAQLNSATVALYRHLTINSVQFEGGSCFIELPLGARVEAVTLMFAITQKLDLILEVDEPNYDYVFYPDGRILSDNGSKGWQDVIQHVNADLQPFARTAAEFKKFAKPYFEELAASYGFKKKKVSFTKETVYCRECNGIVQYVRPRYEKFRFDKFVIYIHIYIFIESVDCIYKHYGFTVFKDFGAFNITISNDSSVFRHTTFDWVVAKQKDLKSVLSRIEQYVFKDIFERATDIHGLDQVLNGDEQSLIYKDLHDIGFDVPASLILAKLAGNPQFELLVKKAEGLRHWGANDDPRKTQWPKLLKYLREEVKPIV